MSRFDSAHVTAWRDEGFAIIPDFFTADEIAPVVQDYERLYGVSGEGDGSALELRSDDESGLEGAFRDKQFQNIDTLPYDGSVDMNLMSLHPALIEFASALLGTDRVHLYQSHTWAKFTGETDYEQAFHCDFSNHTLLVPSDEPGLRSVDFIIYLTDVTDGHGALHYLNKSESNEILGAGRIGAIDPAQQQLMRERERSAASPAGTLVAHSIDTFHRGTNLTLAGGYRYTMTVGYKAAGNEMIGYHVWQQSADKDWSTIIANAKPTQLLALGIPAPGDRYWTERTLRLTKARWPDWDMSEYFAAAGL